MTTPTSPQDAAARAGVSRRTVMRAIKSGDLQATKGNDGRWRIEADALAAWTPPGTPTGQPKGQPMGAPDLAQLLAQSVELERLRGEMTTVSAERDALRDRLSADSAAFRERLDDLRADRDAWRARADRSLLARLFGRF